ncbi:MAG: M42 family metallopeptidase [candidate division WOR-3 bacterium]|nr:M42 family metallopeptidase [candidate division WOR-3 bacterium]
MADRKLLRELTEAFGPSGYETESANIMARELGQAGKVSRDGLGSVVCRVAGSTERPRIMVSAHMDEVGFMVKSITTDGYVRFLPIGGWSPQVLLGQRVLVRTRKGDFTGVIGSKPPHELTEEERKQLPVIDKMFIDLGCAEGFDVKTKLGVRPGDPIVPVSPFVEMGKNLMMAKAWDDRGGCGIVIEAARAIKGKKHPNAVFLVGSVQEEVGLRGARTAAEVVQPDVALALDVSLSYEQPDKARKDLPERLGNGAAILVHDNSMIPNTRLRDWVIDLAEKKKIRYHLTTVRGGYDTGAIHVHRSGVPSLAIGWPTRYIHAHTGIVSAADYDATVRLLTAVIENLDEAVSKSLRSF